MNYYSWRSRSPTLFIIIPMVIAAAGIILFCIRGLRDESEEYRNAEEEYIGTENEYITKSTDSIGNQKDSRFVSGTHIPLPDYIEEVAEEETDLFPDIEVDSTGLLKANGDYRAWLYMDNPAVSYPVVQDPGNDFYINHTFGKQENRSGCLFIDAKAAPDFSDLNTVIYGHNMANGTMLGKLKALYNDPSGFEEPCFYLDVMGKHKTYRIFSTAIVYESSDLFRIPTDSTYNSYVNEVIRCSSSFCDPDCSGLQDRNPIVALSTCYGSSGTDKRLLVFGVLQKSEH